MASARRVAGMVLALVFIAGGGAIAYFSGREMLEADRIRTGARASAVVDECRPTEWRASKGRRRYGFEVRYHFEHEGRAYQGHRYQSGKYSSSRKVRRDRVVAGLAPGAVVTAYFEAGRPERAVLDPALRFDACFPPVLGVGVALVGLAFPFLVSRGRARGVEGLPVETTRAGHVYRVSARTNHDADRGGSILAGAIAGVAGSGVVLATNTPSVALAAGLAGGTVALTAAVFALHRAARREGSGDLIIDAEHQRLAVVGGNGIADEAKAIEFERVLDVELVHVPGKYDRNPKAASARLFPRLKVADEASKEGSRQVKLAQFKWPRGEAMELAEFLRSQLALEGEVVVAKK